MARKRTPKRRANDASAVDDTPSHSPQRASDDSESAETTITSEMTETCERDEAPGASAKAQLVDSDARGAARTSVDSDGVVAIASPSITRTDDARVQTTACARLDDSPSTSAVKVELAIRPVYVMDDDEGNMRIEVLEDVVADLKLELDGYRAATRELAVDLEKKERALEASDKALAYANGQGRERAIAQAMATLEARLEKAERAVERERGDGDAGRAALVKLQALEAELERRMLAQDASFELKWKTRVDEANANQEAFRTKLAALEQQLIEAKMNEEHAKDELVRVRRELDELRASAPQRVPTTVEATAVNGVSKNTQTRAHVSDGRATHGVIAPICQSMDASEEPSEPAKRRGGFFAFITGSDRAEPYGGPKRIET